MIVPDRDSRQSPCTITVVGGGLVGSYVVGLVGRLPRVTAVRLIDGDTYSPENLSCQAILPSDVGQAKVHVLARRLRRQAPHLEVDALHRWVEEVPRGLLRCQAVLCCVDSRRARAHLNAICWRLQTPLLDAGVDGASLLARTNVYLPGPGRPCLECAWEEADYAAQEQVYPCQPAPAAAATGGSAALGSVTAGLLVQQCQHFLEGQFARDMPNQQTLWDLRHSKCLETTYTRNPACRFDHAAWSVDAINLDLRHTRVGDFLDRFAVDGVSATLALEGHQFVRRLVCEHCGSVRDRCLLLDRALTPAISRCSRCQLAMTPSGFHCDSEITVDTLTSSRAAGRSLYRLGLRAHDIVTVRSGAQHRHIQLGALNHG